MVLPIDLFGYELGGARLLRRTLFRSDPREWSRAQSEPPRLVLRRASSAAESNARSRAGRTIMAAGGPRPRAPPLRARAMRARATRAKLPRTSARGARRGMLRRGRRALDPSARTRSRS